MIKVYYVPILRGETLLYIKEDKYKYSDQASEQIWTPVTFLNPNAIKLFEMNDD